MDTGMEYCIIIQCQELNTLCGTMNVQATFPCVCKLFEIIPIPRVKVHALSIYSKQVIIVTHVILTNHGCSQKNKSKMILDLQYDIINQ